MWQDAQLKQYRKQGYLICPGLLSIAETELLNQRVPELLLGREEDDRMHRVYEGSGPARSVFLAHRYSQPFRDLARDRRILEPVRQIIQNDVYVWHSKLNAKASFEGTVWLWHQDYGYWKWDGVKPHLVSVMVFLDAATLTNGCLMVASGSHHWGRQEHYADTETTNYKQWCIDHEALKEKMNEQYIRQITGKPGDVLFFDCNLAHASGHNLSPLSRNVWIVCYNDIDNKPCDVKSPRPDWVVSRDFSVVC